MTASNLTVKEIIKKSAADHPEAIQVLLHHWAGEVQLGKTQVELPENMISGEAVSAFLQSGILLAQKGKLICSPAAWKPLKEEYREIVQAVRGRPQPPPSSRRRKPLGQLAGDGEQTVEMPVMQLTQLRDESAATS